MRSFSRLVASVVLCEGVGLAGGVFTASSVSSWYPLLSKPSFNPPGWIFGPVWTALYFLMGVSLFLVWQSKKKEKVLAFTVFGIQLCLNFLWSLLFFGLMCPGCALIDIALLFISIVLTMVLFFRISRTASLLLIPYVLWVSFASVLNYYLFVLN